MTVLTTSPLIRGRVFVFGNNIDTDLLAPGAYMKGPIELLAQHATLPLLLRKYLQGRICGVPALPECKG